MAESRKVSRTYLPYPSHCALCGSVDRDCLDLGIDYPAAVEADRRGAVLICVNCFRHVAEDIMGYTRKVAPTDLDPKTDAIITDAENRIKKVKNDINELASALDIDLTGLRNYMLSLDSGRNEAPEASGHDDASGQSVDASILKKSSRISSGTSDEPESKLASLLG